MKHNNPSIAERMMRFFNLKSGDLPSNEVLDYLTPVVEMSSYDNVFRGGSTGAASATIYTVPTDRDFYLTGVHLGYLMKAGDLCESISITFTPAGDPARAIIFATNPNVANTNSTFIPFNRIKLQAGSTLVIGRGNTVTAMTYNITGYTVEVVK